MNNSTIISPDEFTSMPWRNGLGTTIEIIKRDLESDDNDEFAWRLSMATVNTDGQFSNFSGYDRTLVLLDGCGITMNHDGIQSDTLEKPLEFASFSGESLTTASLSNGPITDFNIMTRRGVCFAKTQTSTASKEISATSVADVFLVYAAEGDVKVSVGSGDTITAQSRSLLLLDPSPNKQINVVGTAFIVVEIFADYAAVAEDESDEDPMNQLQGFRCQ